MTTFVPEHRALTGVDGLHSLSDESFARIVVETAFRNSRSPHQTDTWQPLLSPGLADRTRQCLLTLRDTHLEAARHRAGELPVSHPDRRRDQEHTGAINRALAQVRSARAHAHLQRKTMEVTMHRGRVRELAVAIARHRAARASSSDTPAGPEDLALWSMLDTLTVPDGPASTPRSLGWLVENKWQ